VLPPPASPGGLSADQQPIGNTTNRINADRKTGMQAGNQPGGHQPTKATTAVSTGMHSQAHMGLVCPHTAHPGGPRSQFFPSPRHVAAGFSVHRDIGTDSPKISSSSQEESQHQVMDPSKMETLMETAQTSKVKSAACCRAAPPTHRQT